MGLAMTGSERLLPTSRLARISAIGWRLLFVAILIVALARAWMAQLYLSALVVVLALSLTLLDLWRLLRREPEISARPAEPAVLRAPAELEAALALIDTVTVALFVLGPDDRIRFMNRAARSLAGRDAGRLQDVAMLGESGAAAVLALPVGGRQLIASEDGRSLLAWIGSIRHAGAEPQRLVSLQSVVGELDAVQVGAWQAMTRVLAHEMMNSLTPIASMAESVESLVAAGDLAPPIANAVTTIGRRSRHLMDFVERYRAIVDLPRPEIEEIRAADFFREIDQLIRPELAKRGISFDVIPPPDGIAKFDRALVEQAVINLIKNAAEAVDHVAEPAVTLTGFQDANVLIVRVSDNGRGIEEDLLEEIFVPFFTTKAGGAGIGLALTRQIALAHGGGLTASRMHPAGSMFELRLPT
jgi:two-component system, NtrC family, nitrogen regulation sensor histidine kinase NtrY